MEVEDDYPDGIVQAEEEEEERLEPEAFSGGAQAVFRRRERVPRMTTFRGSVDSASQPSSGKKRKLDGSAISGNDIVQLLFKLSFLSLVFTSNASTSASTRMEKL